VTSEPALGRTAPGTSNQIQRLFLVAGRHPRQETIECLTLLNMPQALWDQPRLLSAGENEDTVWPQAKNCPSEAMADASNDPQLTATFGTGFHVDGEYSLQALHLQHRVSELKGSNGSEAALVPEARRVSILGWKTVMTNPGGAARAAVGTDGLCRSPASDCFGGQGQACGKFDFVRLSFRLD
jgi:hypothetical protein